MRHAVVAVLLALQVMRCFAVGGASAGDPGALGGDIPEPGQHDGHPFGDERSGTGPAVSLSPKHCRNAAGFAYCPSKARCLKPWMEECPGGIDRSDVRQKQSIGGRRSTEGCLTSAGYTWCEEKRKCLRVWEEVCDNSERGCRGDYAWCATLHKCVRNGEKCA